VPHPTRRRRLRRQLVEERERRGYAVLDVHAGVVADAVQRRHQPRRRQLSQPRPVVRLRARLPLARRAQPDHTVPARL
jgi:hypothetical protein